MIYEWYVSERRAGETRQLFLYPPYAASLCRTAPLIIVAPFSATMIVGALVLVEVTAGITEQA